MLLPSNCEREKEVLEMAHDSLDLSDFFEGSWIIFTYPAFSNTIPVVEYCSSE